jgi:hypothetical protein
MNCPRFTFERWRTARLNTVKKATINRILNTLRGSHESGRVEKVNGASVRCREIQHRQKRRRPTASGVSCAI